MQAGAEKHWRAEVASDAGMADLKAASKTSLKKLDGNALKSSLTTTSKVGCDPVGFGSSDLTVRANIICTTPPFRTKSRTI